MNTLVKLAIAACLSLMAVPTAWADPLKAPAGDVVLVVNGAITNTNGEGKASFDLDMLKALPAVTFKTKTQWTTGETTFTGVALKSFLEAVGATGKNLHSVALNDYAVDVPMSDAIEGGPIIAYTLNGEAMSPRDKGPLWIVYPFDSNKAYRTEAVYSRAIWQLTRIEVQ